MIKFEINNNDYGRSYVHQNSLQMHKNVEVRFF